MIKAEDEMRVFIPSTEAAEIAAKLIEERPELTDIRDWEVSIKYLRSSEAKAKSGKIVYADCYKVPEKIKALTDTDYIITTYADAEDLSDDQKEILILHELLHIRIGMKKDGSPIYQIRPHDIEDFEEIVEEYGIGWSR